MFWNDHMIAIDKCNYLVLNFSQEVLQLLLFSYWYKFFNHFFLRFYLFLFPFHLKFLFCNYFYCLKVNDQSVIRFRKNQRILLFKYSDLTYGSQPFLKFYYMFSSMPTFFKFPF